MITGPVYTRIVLFEKKTKKNKKTNKKKNEKNLQNSKTNIQERST